MVATLIASLNSYNQTIHWMLIIVTCEEILLLVNGPQTYGATSFTGPGYMNNPDMLGLNDQAKVFDNHQSDKYKYWKV